MIIKRIHALSISGSPAVTGSDVSAFASDNVGVVGVQFKLDGVNLGAEDTSAPYSVSWDALSASNGSHTLSATARDASGNYATASITVTVVHDSTPPEIWISAPGYGDDVSGVINIAAEASDNLGVANVYFEVSGAFYPQILGLG